MLYHLDTDFLVHAISLRGPEWSRLDDVISEHSVVEISSIAWYEFCRGRRSPEQLAVARDFFGESGIIAFTEGRTRARG
jgi:hypothetical protein